MKSCSRRRFLRILGGAAALSGAGLPRLLPAAAAVTGRVVVIGGGFGGATCAKYLRRLDAGIDVTVVEAEKTYYTCPMSNWVLGGLRQPDSLAVHHDGLRAHGIKVIRDTATAIDASRRRVTMSGGSTLEFERLVVAPGIGFKWGRPEGYDEAAAELMPHAWKAGPQTELLAKQLLAMEDGGVVAIAVPPAPFRCPPGPYERASLIANYLKTSKPKSKVLILDANDKFSKQALFKEAWDNLYPGLIEWVPVTEDGAVKRVDAGNGILRTDFAEHKVAVANVIPPQGAGGIAVTSGLTDDSGWCPVEARTFESKRMPGIHVIGDACIANPMPKSASAANSQAKNCALAIHALLRGEPPGEPSLHNTCYSLVAPEYAISVSGIYRLADGKIAPVEGSGGVSPSGAAAQFRAREAEYDQGWYESIVADSFG